MSKKSRRRRTPKPKAVDLTEKDDELFSVKVAHQMAEPVTTEETIEIVGGVIEAEPEPEPTVSMTKTQYKELQRLLDSPPGLPAPENRRLIGWLEQVKKAAKAFR